MTTSRDTCCQCGMEKDHWTAPEGFKQDGDVFCCERCAEETGCRCEDQLRQTRAASKPIKAPRGRPGGLYKKRGNAA